MAYAKINLFLHPVFFLRFMQYQIYSLEDLCQWEKRHRPPPTIFINANHTSVPSWLKIPKSNYLENLSLHILYITSMINYQQWCIIVGLTSGLIGMCTIRCCYFDHFFLPQCRMRWSSKTKSVQSRFSYFELENLSNWFL